MVPFAVVIVCLALCVTTFFLIRHEVRTASEDTLAKLRDMLRKGHGYSDPSAAAVVTDVDTTLPTGAPEPLPAVERRIVTVTRDDDPVHTRPTAPLIPPPGDPDEEAMRLEYAEWAALQDARADWASLRSKWEAAEDERAKALDAAGEANARAASPRPTPEEVTGVLTSEPDAADAMIPGVPVRQRGTVVRGKAGERFITRLPWEPTPEGERPWPELTGDADSTPPRSILPPPPDKPKK